MQGNRVVDEAQSKQLVSLLDEVIRNCERIKKDVGENKVNIMSARNLQRTTEALVDASDVMQKMVFPSISITLQNMKDASDQWAAEFHKEMRHQQVSLAAHWLIFILNIKEFRDYFVDHDPTWLGNAQKALSGKNYLDYIGS
jgi:hypothetical protein